MGIAVVTVTLLLGCGPDETISGYATAEATYVLTEIDGLPFETRATIRFPEEGQIAGTGPCNSYTATQSAPYPWFESGALQSSRRACPDLVEETRFFDTLQQMTLAEVLGPTLILSTTDGRQMVFQSE